MQYLPYVTADNDRWDLIAHRHYGATRFASKIIDANRHLFVFRDSPCIPAILEAGTELRIPVLEETQDESTLPPWKRGQAQP